MFNLLDASGGVGVTERTAYILRVRQIAVAIAKRWAGLDDFDKDSRPTANLEDHKEHQGHEGGQLK
jgi:glycyl-tRNA synthetase alpha subunit